MLSNLAIFFILYTRIKSIFNFHLFITPFWTAQSYALAAPSSTAASKWPVLSPVGARLATRVSLV